MKKLSMVGSLLAGLLLMFSVSGNAQVSRQYSANVPFDFNVNNKLMKAGEYTLGPTSGITNQRAIALSSDSGKATIVGQAAIGSSQGDVKGTMTFTKSGDEWVLQSIETPGFALKLKSNKTGVKIVASASDAPESKTIILQN